MSDIVVDSTAGLSSALRAAQDGDVIKLAPGVYDGLAIKNVNFEQGVTITSLDPEKFAVLTDFSVKNASGITFRQLEMATIDRAEAVAKGSSGWAFQVRDSEHITFDRVRVHGSLDNDASNDVHGLNILESKHISVIGSEFQQLGRALAFGAGEYIKVAGNNAHDLRTDGFDFAEVGHVEITGNTLRNFRPAEGDHPDAIQFWTTGTKTASHDILISHNVIMKGEGMGTQGIFLRDQGGALPYERVTISDNLVVGTGYNAIRVNGAKDLTLLRNELVSFAGDYKTTLLIQATDGLVAHGNRAIAMSFGDSTNVVQDGNVTTDFVGDLGAKAIQGWLRANPAADVTAQDLLPIDFQVDPSFQPVAGSFADAVAAPPPEALSAGQAFFLEFGHTLFGNFDFV